MLNSMKLFLVASASLALFACSSDSGSSKKGSQEACTANAECASGICAVVSTGSAEGICGPASDACNPACAEGSACVAVVGGGGACYPTLSGPTAPQGGEGGEPNTGGAAGQGGSDVGQGGSAGSENTGGSAGSQNTGGTGGGNGGNTDPGQQQCVDMISCFNACPDDASGQACVQNCFETATPEAQNRYQAILGCAQAAGCTGLDGSIDQTCLNEECSAELEACFGPTAEPMGTLDCNDYLGCLNNCPADDDGTCRFDCTEAASPEGYDTFNAVVGCLQDNMCFNANGGADSACLEPGGVCAMAWEACVGPAAMPMGTGTCQDFVQCFTGCPQGDGDCVNACVEATSPEGYDDYNAVIECGQTNMCFDDAGNGDQACFDANCAAEQVPCFGEPLVPMGDGDCIALTACLDACDPMAADNRETCVRPCVEASSQAGFDNLNALQECITNSTDATGAPCPDLACVQTACNAEAGLCYADGMIPAP
ncbi:MAG: hypothetical protein ACPGQS_02625 [Bradymonadia bacterium]